MSNNIISLAGRLRSGKGELSKILERKGYEPIYFAIPLKKMCGELLGVDFETLERMKNNNEHIDFEFTKEDCKYISEKTSIPEEYICDKLYGSNVDNVRGMLQYVGTNVIREYNPDWHVNEIKKMIDPDKKYVFNDTRFPNETKMVEDMGGDNWFIVRPYIKELSHHISEESLKWQMFGYNTILSEKLEELSEQWDMFTDNYEENKELRNKRIEELKSNPTDISDGIMGDDWKLLINRYMFEYKPIEFNKNNIESYACENDVLSILNKFGSIEIIDNPYNIEDFKIFA